MISRDLAEKFIEQVTKHTDYNVNIMDEDGVIVASRDPERIGQYHEIAYRIVHGKDDIVDTTEFSGIANVRPGINMVIDIDGRREGVIGITGDPVEIRPVALIVKMAIETMLRYERQQEMIRLRENRKAAFIHLLTEVQMTNPEDLREMAKELGYPEEMIRIPILIRCENVDSSEMLQMFRESKYHTHKDFSIAPDQEHVLIFKCMPEGARGLFTDYKYIIGEYLSPVLQWLRRNDRKARFYIGSFQESYSTYYYAYQHAKWVEKAIESRETAIFFYDHIREYLYEAAPLGELTHILSIYESRFPEDQKDIFIETFDQLIRTNYNFKAAADALYVHKNTLFYRYNKFKQLMDIDPINRSEDRSFVEAFYFYLQRRRRSGRKEQ